MEIGWTLVPELSPAEREAMCALLDRHFIGVDRAGFAEDLAGKQAVARILDGGRLLGFTTIAYERLDHDGTGIGAVWSGDTIVDPEAWHATGLPVAWTRAVRHLHRDRGRLAWCLICSGVRTVRFMPAMLRSWAPGTADGSTDLRDRLARHRYGDGFADGIVRLARPQMLRPHLAGIPDRLAAEPAVTRFLADNPGHGAGDELACAGWLEPWNLTALGRRVWSAAER